MGAAAAAQVLAGIAPKPHRIARGSTPFGTMEGLPVRGDDEGGERQVVTLRSRQRGDWRSAGTVEHREK